MKKTIKSIAALFVILTLCLGLLAGCSGGSPAGTWKLTGGEALGTSVGADQLGDTSNSTLVLNEDGTVQGGGTWKLTGGEVMGSSVGANELGDTSSSTLVLKEDGTVEGGGTWKLEGSTLKISESGMSLDCEYNGSNIIINMGFMKMIYSRA